MKNGIIILSLLILLLPTAFADTPIFSGALITDQDKSIDGKIFRFTYDEASNNTFVRTPAQNMIVENGKCNSNGLFKVCVNSASYYDRNITTYATYYQLYVYIYKLTGSLSAATTSTNHNLLQGEAANITVTLTNPTGFDLSNILYSESIPDFAIINVDGCALRDDKISWSGPLQAGYKKTCIIEVIARQNGTYSMTGTLSYFNGFEAENKSTDTLTINVLPAQLSASQLSDDNVEFGQAFYINETLKNINPTESMDLSITIGLPRNFILLNRVEGFGRDESSLRRDSRLESGSALNYSLYLKSDAESKIPITQTFDYKIKGLQYMIQGDIFVKAPEPKLLVNLSSEYLELAPDQNFIVTVKVKNPSRIYEMTDVKARLTATNNNAIEQKVAMLAPNESTTLISSEVIAPSDIQGNEFQFGLSVDYKLNDALKSANKSLVLKLKYSNTTQGNETTKENLQSQQETKETKAPAKTSSLSNESKPIAAKMENPKPPFIGKGIILYIISGLVAFMAASFIINRIRKRKKPEAYANREALSGISNALENMDNDKKQND